MDEARLTNDLTGLISSTRNAWAQPALRPTHSSVAFRAASSKSPSQWNYEGIGLTIRLHGVILTSAEAPADTFGN